MGTSCEAFDGEMGRLRLHPEDETLEFLLILLRNRGVRYVRSNPIRHLFKFDFDQAKVF